MPKIALSSFLKIVGLGTPQKAREYAKYLSPGGYDFYWQLKEAAHALTIEGQPFDRCVQPINQIKRDAERKHNHDGLKALNAWISGRGYTFFTPPQGSCSSPKKLLTVKLEPEFGYYVEGKRRIVYLWSSKTTELKSTIAGIGIYLMQRHLAVGEYQDCACTMLDIRKSQLFVSDKLPSQIPLMVSSEFAWADNFFEQQEQAA